jgi:hypothetical protein
MRFSDYGIEYHVVGGEWELREMLPLATSKEAATWLKWLEGLVSERRFRNVDGVRLKKFSQGGCHVIVCRQEGSSDPWCEYEPREEFDFSCDGWGRIWDLVNENPGMAFKLKVEEKAIVTSICPDCLKSYIVKKSNQCPYCKKSLVKKIKEMIGGQDDQELQHWCSGNSAGFGQEKVE